jgi:hypothetical protein
LNGTHQLLAYPDDLNLLGDNRYYKENIETLIDSSKEQIGVRIGCYGLERGSH